MTKKQKRIRKEEFIKEHSMALVQNFNCKIYQHHLKIEIKGVECDYYPGAGRLNRIINGKYEWSDLEPDDFLKLIGLDIEPNKDIEQFIGIETFDI